MKKNQWFIPIRGNRLRKLWLMARLLFVFVFANLLHVSATAYSQNRTVTLQMKEATLEEVVQALKLQTDYGLFLHGAHVQPLAVDLLLKGEGIGC